MRKLPADAFHRDEAIDAGFSPAQLRQRVNSGEWAQLLPRVYVHGATPITPMVWRRAALVWSGPAATLSDRSAAVMWNLDRVTEPLPELTVGCNLRAPATVLVAPTR
jgi:hypothetical protein